MKRLISLLLALLCGASWADTAFGQMQTISVEQCEQKLISPAKPLLPQAAAITVRQIPNSADGKIDTVTYYYPLMASDDAGSYTEAGLRFESHDFDSSGSSDTVIFVNELDPELLPVMLWWRGPLLPTNEKFAAVKLPVYPITKDSMGILQNLFTELVMQPKADELTRRVFMRIDTLYRSMTPTSLANKIQVLRPSPQTDLYDAVTDLNLLLRDQKHFCSTGMSFFPKPKNTAPGVIVSKPETILVE